MAINSREKGKVGEREAAAALGEAIGIEFRRGQQFRGGPGSPDIVPCDGRDIGLHFEVKRSERLNLYEAMSQAVADAGGDVPVVLHRKNSQAWVLVVRIADVMELCRRLVAVTEKKDSRNEA